MTPTPAQLTAAIEEEFKALLTAKTGWRRNELGEVLQRAIAKALLRFL